LKLANLKSLTKVSDPNDKIRQTVDGDSGKRRLLGQKFGLENLAVALVGYT
jgi:hypothetical protein